MTTILSSCPICGDVELTPAQMRLVVCSRTEWSFFSFRCDTCGDEIRKPADDETVVTLVSGGVLAEQWVIPAEAFEEHSGPAITYDDVLNMHEALDGVSLLTPLISTRIQA